MVPSCSLQYKPSPKKASKCFFKIHGLQVFWCAHGTVHDFFEPSVYTPYSTPRILIRLQIFIQMHHIYAFLTKRMWCNSCFRMLLNGPQFWTESETGGLSQLYNTMNRSDQFFLNCVFSEPRHNPNANSKPNSKTV